MRLTPVGNPDTVTVAAPLKPLIGMSAIVSAWSAIVDRLSVDGPAKSWKSGAGAATMSDNVALCVNVPETPCNVTVADPAVALLLASKLIV